ncbi:hypothetical protein ACOMHN_046460 [Nucella lapillus]
MAHRRFLSRQSHVLIAAVLGLVISDVTMAMTSNLWDNTGENIVTSSVKTSNASRAASKCVMDCQQMGDCVSAAFDPKADVCYLQPSFRPARQGDDGPPLRVYLMEKVAECKPSEAPDIANAHVTKWQKTSSSLDGDVSCDEDYMLSAEDTPQVRCHLSNGRWTTRMQSTCKQFAWRNHTAHLEPAKHCLPRPAAVGLCVRVKGTPILKDRVYVDLTAIDHNIVLRVEAKLDYMHVQKTTILNYRRYGMWGHNEVMLTHHYHPFPFANGVPFDMVITAKSLKQFNVRVNGAQYGDFTGHLPVTDVNNVMAGPVGSLSLESLTIGC